MSRPDLAHDVRLVDTTLRDGSHAMAHQFTEAQVRDTVRALDRAGVGSAPSHLADDLERDEALRGAQQGQSELVGHRGDDEGHRGSRPGLLGTGQPHGRPGEQGGTEAGRRGAA